jgi:hypothetical protein
MRLARVDDELGGFEDKEIPESGQCGNHYQ